MSYHFAADYVSLCCLICGKRGLLLQKGPRVISYCSSACRQKAYRQRKKAES